MIQNYKKVSEVYKIESMKHKRLHLLFLATMSLFGYPMIAGYLDAGMFSVLIV